MHYVLRASSLQGCDGDLGSSALYLFVGGHGSGILLLDMKLVGLLVKAFGLLEHAALVDL